MSCRHNQSGFSLIEMVLALAVFAMLATVLQASLFSGRKILATVEGKTSAAGDLLVARRVFESWVQGAVTGTDIIFDGRADAIEFTTLSESFGHAGPARVRLKIIPSQIGNRLVAERITQQPGALPESSSLLDWAGPLGFEFALGRENLGLTWVTIADGTKGLPARIRLTTAAGPLMTARVAAEVDLRCLQVPDRNDQPGDNKCLLR
jgi:prepilin-type N-terminal cleavage/methylation domain-containing protein